MRIRVNNQIFEDVLVSDYTDSIRIRINDDIGAELIKAITGTTSIEFLSEEDDTVASTISETFVNPCIIVTPTDTTVQFIKKREDIDDVKALNKRIADIEESFKTDLEPLSIVFVQMAQDGTLDDITISEHPDMFSEWNENWTGKAGTILRDEGALYKSIHDITNTAQNTKPSETPSMWTRIGDPTEEYPEWVQPIGAHDVYTIGDKVSHKGKKWVNELYEANNWEPGEFGWTEVTE